MEKTNWKVELSLEGKMFHNIKAFDEGEAIDRVLSTDLSLLFERAEEKDVDIDVVKVWKEE